MKKIKLNNKDGIDLTKLIDSRLLVQANSGGGKSWLIRRLLEQSHGKVQQIVIDLEGEFSTLREKYDYILAGKGGDVPAETRSAGLLAHKVLELNVSAIVDLYELKAHDRKRFVKLFLDALVNAPKKLWKPCLIILDEAHVFCPEKGSAESMEAVIDLATRGRKRGYCAVLATQRLSKLHKDAAAECNNKLIGRTGLDIDRKRASEELGFTTKEQNLSLRDLEAGEFYAFGTAISKDVTKIKVGDVKTTHPKAGARIKVAVTPPTSKIKSVLKKLTDLPEEARKKNQTMQEMKEELTKLRRHKCPKAGDPEQVQKKIDASITKALAVRDREWKVNVSKAQKEINVLINKLNKIASIAAGGGVEMREVVKGTIIEPTTIKVPSTETIKAPKNRATVARNVADLHIEDEGEERPIKGGAMRMLKVLVSRYPMQFTKSQLATFSKMSPRSGTFGQYLSLLRTRGMFEEEGDLIRASQEALDELDEQPTPPQSFDEVVEMWRGNLKGGARRMFDVLVEYAPSELTKEELGEHAGLSPNSGTFGQYLSMLRSNGLIESTASSVKISDNLLNI